MRLHVSQGRWLFVLAAAVTLLAACTSGDKPPPTVEASATPVQPPTAVIIDWVDFIHFDGIEYLRATRSVTIDETGIGPQFSTVQFNVSENVTDPSYRPKDGDAARLDAGTPVYEVRGYAPEFRLAARSDGRLLLYEVFANPVATRGSDLLDIGGKVVYIGVNSATDGRTELAAIDDPDEVAALVELVLAAPVDQNNQDHEGQRYFIAFHLTDGTEVVRSYWLESGELSRGVILPPEFATAVERALARQTSRSDPGGSLDRPPALTASAGAQSAALRLGTNCWTSPGGPGLCADAFGIITGRVALPAGAGGVVVVSGDLSVAGASVVTGWAISRPAEPLADGDDWLAWSPAGDDRVTLEIALSGDALTFDADLPPGRYVVALFLDFPQGDASYGLLLDVE